MNPKADNQNTLPNRTIPLSDRPHTEPGDFDADDVERFVQAVRKLPTSARSVYLDDACASTPALRQAVEARLAAVQAQTEAVREAFDQLPAVQPDLLNLTGQTIAQYDILSPLGQGGMGVVFKAHDTKLDRTVALKFLPPRSHTSDEHSARFIREAQAAAALNHPHICIVHEINQVDGHTFIAMEWINGPSLKDKLAQGRLTGAECLDIALQVVHGLDAAYQKGIIHRDVKPANLMLNARSQVKIMDFGLAKLTRQASDLTQTGNAVGTVVYMSPEQAKGFPLDHRTDLWSFGVVLYEMVAGRRPFEGNYDLAALYGILNETPPEILDPVDETARALLPIIDRCLQKDKEARYQSPAELLTDLNALIQGTGPTLMPAPPPAPATPTSTQPTPAQSIPTPVQPTKRTSTWLGLGLVATAVVVALWMFMPSGTDEKHLAVLPFQGTGLDPILMDGLVETVTNQLARLESFQEKLWVVPASEVRDLSSPGEAYDRFRTNLVVKGTYLTNEEQIRLTQSLNDAKQARILQSSSFDGRVDNLLAFQDRVLDNLIEMLNLEINPEIKKTLNAGGTREPGAYELYIQGRGYLQRYEDPKNINTAIDLFTQAIAEDPNYALAYAGLGEAYWRKFEVDSDTQWVAPALENARQAESLDRRLVPVRVVQGRIQTGTGRYDEAIATFRGALAVEPNHTDALLGLADAYYQNGDVTQAEPLYKRAIDTKPDYWIGYNRLGRFYFRIGRVKEATRQFEQIIRLTPDNPYGFINAGAAYWNDGQADRAIEMFERSLNIQPEYSTYSNLAAAYFSEKRYEAAAEAYLKALEIKDTDYQTWSYLATTYENIPGKTEDMRQAAREAIKQATAEHNVNPKDEGVLSSLANLHFMLGDRTQSEQYLEQAVALNPTDVQTQHWIGTRYIQLGNLDTGLSWLDRALQQGLQVSELEEDPELDAFRQTSAYQTLIFRHTNPDAPSPG